MRRQSVAATALWMITTELAHALIQSAAKSTPLDYPSRDARPGTPVDARAGTPPAHSKSPAMICGMTRLHGHERAATSSSYFAVRDQLTFNDCPIFF